MNSRAQYKSTGVFRVICYIGVPSILMFAGGNLLMHPVCVSTDTARFNRALRYLGLEFFFFSISTFISSSSSFSAGAAPLVFVVVVVQHYSDLSRRGIPIVSASITIREMKRNE